MNTLPAVQTDTPLLATFAERLNRVIDHRPDVCRKGRGRVGDFAERFNLHYTTAHRVLHATTFPTPELLLAIRSTFDVSLDWLMGVGGDQPGTNDAQTPLRVDVFDPLVERPEALWLPPGLLPTSLAGQTLVAAVINGHPMNGPDRDLALVPVMEQIVDGAVHVIYDPARGRNVLMRLSMSLSHTRVTAISVHSGETEHLDTQQLQFGQTHGALLPSVIGPVVATLTFQPRLQGGESGGENRLTART
jgi:hypothetical protein